SNPRSSTSTPASTCSAMGVACTPAEFVMMTSLVFNAGNSSAPTPAAAECTHRRCAASAKSAGDIPNPAYTSASLMAARACLLGGAPPSPSEIVGASMTIASQPAGAASRSWAMPSGGSAHVAAVALRSATRRRGTSVHVHAHDILTPAQRVDQHIEALGGPDERELERAVTHVIVR